MKILCKPFFKNIFLLFLLFFLSGCYGAVHVASLALSVIPRGMMIYNYLPSGTEVELSKTDGGATQSMVTTKSVVTSSKPMYEYLDASRDTLFKKVILVSEEPLTSHSAAAIARKSGADAFVTVDVTGLGHQRSFMSRTKIHGAIRVTLIAQSGDLLYEQTATLKQKATSAENLSDKQIYETLARVIIDDLKNSKEVTSPKAKDGKMLGGVF
jgi:hypothetical protein